MTAGYRSLIMTSVASLTPTALLFTGVTYLCSRAVEDPEKRGPFLPRLKEVASAFFYDESRPGAAKGHLATTLCLSSKEFAHSGRARMESKPYSELVSKGQRFLFRAVINDPGNTDATLVFRRGVVDNTTEFVFSGKSTSIFDPESREKILEAKYSRCSVIMQGSDQLKKYDVIVVNDEEDPNACAALGQAFQNAVDKTCRAEPYKRRPSKPIDYYGCG